MSLFNRTSLGLLVLLGAAACSKDDVVTPSAPALRPAMDYATLTAATPYTTSFKDASGAATVDLGAAAVRLDMFSELNTYMATVASATAPAVLDVARLRNFYAGENSPFDAVALNTAAAAGVRLRDKTAASLPDANATAVRGFIDTKLAELATASQARLQAAAPGQAGHHYPVGSGTPGRYLVDGRGIEVNQVIQKGLIGALLLDQIGNVLLSPAALAADNGKVVAGKVYSEREHNWDLAYGYLTSNAIMTTDIALMPRERFLAGYLNEKNGPASPGVYMALLKGRAAIVNNDEAMLKTQADFIRTELEKTIAKSAVSYLELWKSNATMDAKAHALAEGLGFIYSLRFCTKHNADAAWADAVLNDLISGANGVWDMNATKANTAVTAINTKFSL